MAIARWVGTNTGNEGDYNVAANWSPSGVPVDGDTLIFENSSQPMNKGYAGVIDAYTSQVLITRSSFSAAIGSLSVPLLSSFARAQVGGGSVFLDLQDETSRVVLLHGGSLWLDGTISELSVVQLQGGTAPLLVYGQTSTTDRTISTLRAAIGSITLKAGTLARATMLTGATMVAEAGTITAMFNAGVLQLNGANCLALEQFGGATRIRNNATYDQWELWGGLLDCSSAAEDVTWSASPRMYADARVDFRNGQSVIDQSVKVYGSASPTYDAAVLVGGTAP